MLNRQNTAMTLLGQLLLLAVAIPSALPATRLSCDCRLSNNNYLQYHVGCSNDRRNQNAGSGVQSQCGKPNLSCSKDLTVYVPEGYEYVTPGWLYKVYHTALTYDKAAAQCRHDGGKLAIPTSRVEAVAIASIIRKSRTIKQAFIGITDIAEKGSYVSTDGTPLSQLGYAEWVPGQPDNWLNAENCLTIDPSALYNDFHCNWELFFVCQRRVSPVPPDGYKYLPQLGFYRHYTTPPKNFAAARKNCLDDGGYLAVIETQKEAEELVKLFDVDEETPESWIGLNDIEKEGVYTSETGKTLEDLSYVNWSYGEPNNLDNENCIVFRTDGNYNDAHCHLLKSYFCEFPLPRKIAT